MHPSTLAFAFCLLVMVCTPPALAQVTPPTYGPPSSVGIDYPIVACRMPKTPNDDPDWFPDIFNHSLFVGRGSDLVLIQPNATETVLVDASAVAMSSTPGGPTRTSANASIVDPLVSFDGKTVYFALFEDPINWHFQRRVSLNPSYIFKVTVATGVVTQLTFGDTIPVADQSRPGAPPHVKYDVAPVELADGRLLFLSNRDGVMEPGNVKPAMSFYRIHGDGSNLEALENFTMGTCEHPIILQDGRIVWTHFHPTGRRATNGNYPLFVANPDMSDIKTFAGAHYYNTGFHFISQLSNGDFVTAAYYQANNFGHGNIIRFPVNPQPQVFHGVSPNCGYNQYGVNDHFARVGQTIVTPWALGAALNDDQASPLVPGTTTGERVGKVTMPAGAPGGHMLMAWSPGPVNKLNRPVSGLPHMHVAFAPNGNTPTWGSMTIIAGGPQYHYMYPKPLVTYAEIHGMERPALIPDTPYDQAIAALVPAGSPYATTGTSSVYNRESAWNPCYVDPFGPHDPFDPNITNSHDLQVALFNVGQDTYAFPNSEIHAAQVVVDMSHFYHQSSWHQPLLGNLRSHNNGTQVWAILGETPLRKNDDAGNTITDPMSNPDTSYEVRIPADVPFHNRIIDRNGITLTSEWTWHSARPGERKTNCGGCHAHSDQVFALPFNQTAAGGAVPGYTYTIPDFAQSTPMVSQDAQGNSTVSTLPQKLKVVEYWQDVQPVLTQYCAPCHGPSNPAGGLRLDAASNPWDHLAYTDTTNTVMFGFHQATKYVRKHAASQSLLAWKTYGSRMDGRMDTSRPFDVDYGVPVPDPNHPATAVPFDQRRLVAAWIDLGCLVDMNPAAPNVNDPYDDQMKPTLVVTGVPRGLTTSAPTTVTISAFDMHSPLKADSLEVRIGSWTAPDIASMSVSDGQVVQVPLPAFAKGQTHTIYVAVADTAGTRLGTPNQNNVVRAEVTFTHLDPASLTVVGMGTPGTGQQIPTLSASSLPTVGNQDFALEVGNALPNTQTAVYWSDALASPPIPLNPPNAFIYLATLNTFLLAPTDGSGGLSAPFPIPNLPAYNGASLHFQALVLDPGGQVLLPGVTGAVTAGLTVTIGG